MVVLLFIVFQPPSPKSTKSPTRKMKREDSGKGPIDVGVIASIDQKIDNLMEGNCVGSLKGRSSITHGEEEFRF